MVWLFTNEKLFESSFVGQSLLLFHFLQIEVCKLDLIIGLDIVRNEKGSKVKL